MSPFSQRDSRDPRRRFGLSPLTSAADAIKAVADIRSALVRDVGHALRAATQFRPQALEALDGVLSEQTAAVSGPAESARQPPTATLTRGTITRSESAAELVEASEPTVQHDVPILLVPRQARPSSAQISVGEMARPLAPSSATPLDRQAFEEFARTGNLAVAANGNGLSVEVSLTTVSANQLQGEDGIAVFTPVGSFQGRSAVNEQGRQVLVVDEAEATAPIPAIPGAFVGVELTDASFNQVSNESHGTISLIAGVEVANAASVSVEQELFTFETGPRGVTHVAAGPDSASSGEPSIVSETTQLREPATPDSSRTFVDALGLPSVSLADADTPENAVLVIEGAGEVTTVQGPLIAAIASGLIAGALVLQRADEGADGVGQAGKGAADAMGRRMESAASAVQGAASGVREVAKDASEASQKVAADTAELTRDTASATVDVVERAATATVDRGGQAVETIAEFVADPASSLTGSAKTVVCLGIFCG